jgi:hypothetical protein
MRNDDALDTRSVSVSNTVIAIDWTTGSTNGSVVLARVVLTIVYPLLVTR